MLTFDLSSGLILSQQYFPLERSELYRFFAESVQSAQYERLKQIEIDRQHTTALMIIGAAVFILIVAGIVALFGCRRGDALYYCKVFVYSYWRELLQIIILIILICGVLVFKALAEVNS